MPPRRRQRGPAIPSEHFATKVNILSRFRTEIPFSLDGQDDSCHSCKASRWKIERRVKDKNALTATYSNCCQQGNVELPLRYFPEDIGEQIPDFYHDLLTGQDETSKKFRMNIQKYNNALSFVSLGATIDRSVAGQRGIYVFRISGQLSHLIGSLMPMPGDQPAFSQIFTYGGGGEQEADLRLDRSRGDLDPEILLLFQEFMDQHNPYAQVFRSAAEICNEESAVTLRIKTISAPGTDHRRYNRPTSSEVAAIIEGDGRIGAQPRDIILHRQSGALQRVSELHTAYFALRYPLLFLYGSQTWHEGFTNPTATNPDGKISNLEWFAYLLFQRPSFSVILASGRLFQEFCVDMYVCVEHARLQYFRFHQKELRAEMYSGVVEVLGNELQGEVVGKRVVLPSSFTGGPRYMQQTYQDAMSLVAEYGSPSLFITMTANPQWPEVLEALEDGQTPEDRPDLVARSFYVRYHSMLEDVTKRERFGKSVAYVYTIEFQKRGLPHGHLILFLDQSSRPTTPERVDCMISAHLPDPEREPILFDLVTHYMLHGPCQGYKCWTGSECKLGYPRPFCETTTLPENSYPTYKRPNNGRFFDKGSIRYENGSVVPYNRFLLLKYRCHINVEVAASIRAIKYLFKYILKGHDRTIAHLEEENSNDEILAFVNARFLSAPEAIWRLLQYEITGRHPPVQRLSVHVEDGQTVFFYDEDGLRRAMETDRAERTTLTEFFRLCREDAPLYGSNQSIRTIKYHQVPRYFCWDQKEKVLTPRKNSVFSIGRVHFAHIKRGEVYYVQLLLSHVPGPTSFEYLRTVDGVVLSTFREAAEKLGLLLDDRNYNETLEEAAIWKTGHQLRNMFAIIVCHSSPANPARLWENHKVNLSDDCERQLMRLNPHLEPNEEHVYNYALYLLERTFLAMETTLDTVGLPSVDQQLIFELGLPDEARTDRAIVVHPDESRQKYLGMIAVMTNKQKAIVGPVCEAISQQTPYLAFLDGPGGTGKTFVLNSLLHYCNSHQISFRAVSAAGIASLLLLHGRTAHSAFKIPIPVYDDSVCPISPREALGRELQDVRFIVWDEVAMQHRHAIECVDRTLRDITGTNLPFGGKVVLFAGDFRQILPVVRRSNLAEQAQATLKGSLLWNSIEKFKLSVNIRLGGNSARQNPTNMNFAKWLLDLGSGHLQDEYISSISLKYCNVFMVRPPSTFDPQLLQTEYHGVDELIRSQVWGQLTELYSSRCLITPLNSTVHEINTFVMDSLPGTYHTSFSLDLMDDEFANPITADVLNTFNFPGFPNHKLRLKVGASVMLLRNLNLTDGLCNGTRLLITHCGVSALQCRILTGEKKGTVVSLPKIKLHHEGNQDCPIPFYRYQFPIMPAFCMTINKSQGQSLERVSVLLPQSVFSHGQLYVALSRCTNASNVQVCIVSDSNTPTTKNIVYHPVLMD